MTKLIFDEETHRIIGVGVIVGPHAGDMIKNPPAVEMGADAIDIGKTTSHPGIRFSAKPSVWRLKFTKVFLYLISTAQLFESR